MKKSNRKTNNHAETTMARILLLALSVLLMLAAGGHGTGQADKEELFIGKPLTEKDSFTEASPNVRTE